MGCDICQVEIEDISVEARSLGGERTLLIWMMRRLERRV
jgi:hypothetical protein